MNWVKLGSKTINLDLVVSYHEDEEGAVELYCIGDEDEPSYELCDEEAVAFKKFMAASGWVKIAFVPLQDDLE
jgi:hypothetical protein